MGFFEKGILIYLLIAVAVSFWQPTIIFNGENPYENNLLSWFNVKINTTTNEIYYDTTEGYEASTEVDQATDEALRIDPIPSGTNFLTFLDPIFKVIAFAGIIVKFIFSPIIILTKPQFTGMPVSIILMFAIPLVTLFLVSVFKWIRNGE